MPITRKSLAAAGCALLIAASASCDTSERADAETRARRAVEKLGEWEAVSVTARVEAPADDVYAFLRRLGGREGGALPSRTDALALSRMETAITVGADKPLKDVGEGDRLDSGTMVNFGGVDLAGYKSIGTDFYVRADWTRLASELNWGHATVTQAAELAGSADELPPSLAAARDMFQGRWVQIDPEEFDHFARAVGGKYGERAERLANSVDLLQSARAQHHVVDSVRRALDEHASFRDAGRRDGAEHITVSLPARAVARDLAAALGPLEERFDGIGFAWLERAPDREVTVDLALRDGALSGMTVDLAQFAGPEDPEGSGGSGDSGGSGKLPLTLFFAAGQAVPVEAPQGAKWLDPQDVMAAALYGELDASGS
ncbi:MAG TPA: hypothetical protein VE546_20005 [Streptomyces sp.]|uniref:hypothetical protein n=1 Tax=Streptomyces sp. TaxID=1931 RepID=UPI002D6ABC94|nr:hypothetical protein [Streptomyces sp.]HZG05828.1 hypothetical protein [Streptomyces sp.]